MTARHWILCRVIGITILAALIALAAVLPLSPELTRAQSGGPTVADVAVTSSPASGDTYLLGETIRVSVTFSESVDVDTAGGTPRLKIDMDPAYWGEKWAGYHSGSGTATLTFTHTVVEPNYSTQGIAVLANSLELSGGTIRSSASQTEANLSHDGKPHAPEHKVNWQRPPPTPMPTPSPAPTPEPTPAPTPSVTNVAISSTPASGDTYGGGETIRVSVTFSESVDVETTGGTPRLKIDMDRADWGEKWASYEGGSGTTTLTFTHTVVEPNYSTQGVAVLANSLELNGGTIRSSASQTDADLSHDRQPHAPEHKVDWELVPNHAPVVDTQSYNYSVFTSVAESHWDEERRIGTNSDAPRGILRGQSFYGIFSDPDGDELSYTVSVREEQRELVEELRVTRDEAIRERQEWLRDEPVGKYDVVWLLMDAEDDWKAIEPALADPLIVRVTLTATDPGGLSASVEGGFRTDWSSEPELVGAASDGASIELTYDLELDGGSVPTVGQFTVKVVDGDGSEGTVGVSGVSVSGKVVTLGLASALAEGQAVTLDYAYDDQDDDHAPLQRAGGGDPVPGFTGQAVELTVIEPPGAIENFSVSAEPGQQTILATWNAVEGATSYRLRWRPTGGEFDAGNAATVTEAISVITVSSYGEWEVRAQACSDAGCGPEASSTVDVVRDANLRLERAVDDEGNIRPRTINANWDPVTGAGSYILRWRRLGADVPVQEQLQSQRNAVGRQPRSVSGFSAQGFNAQSENQLTLPADQTSADITVPDDGAYEFDLQVQDEDNEILARASGMLNQRVDQPDTTPPRLVRGEIDGKTMTLYFSEPLDEESGGDGDIFRPNLRVRERAMSEINAAPREIIVSRNKVVLVDMQVGTKPGFAGNKVRYIQHADPTADRLRDLSGNAVHTPYLTGKGYWITGYIPLDNVTGLLPLPKSATVNRDRLTLTFDGALDENSVSAADAFTVKVNGSAVSLANADPVAISGDTVTLTLAVAVAEGDAVTVSYARPATNPLRNAVGEFRHFVDLSATNHTVTGTVVTDVAVSSAPTSGNTYGDGETIRVTVTFSEAVNVDTAGGTPRLKIDFSPGANDEKWAGYSSGSGTTELIFQYTVAADRSRLGVAVPEHSLDLNGGTIRSTATQTGAHLWYEGLDPDPDHKVDGVAPLLWSWSPRVTGTQLTLTYDEALDEDSVPPGSAFTVKVDGNEVSLASVNPVTISGNTVTLTLDVAVAEDDTVTVSYTRPTAAADSKLKDALGNETASFTDQPASTDTTPPRLVRGEIDGKTMTLYFSEPLDEESGGDGDIFRPHLRVRERATNEMNAIPREIIVSRNKVVLVDMQKGTKPGFAGNKVRYIQHPDFNIDRLRDLAGNAVHTPYLIGNGYWITGYIPLDNITGRPEILPVSFRGWLSPTWSSPTGVVVSSDAGDDRFYMPGDIIKVKLIFSEAVNVDTAVGTPRLKIDMDPADWGQKWASYESGSGTNTLTFTHTVVSPNYSTQGIAVLANSLELNGGTIRSASSLAVENARLGHGGLGHDSRHRVISPSSADPVLVSVSVSGTALTLTFSEALGAASSLENSAFTVKKTPQDGDEETVSLSGSPAISGATVSLTLASVALATDIYVKVSYSKPTSGTGNKLVDAAGNEAANFTDEPVTNALDTTKPRLLSGEIEDLAGNDDAELTLYFSEPMDEHSWGTADFYRLYLRSMPERAGRSYTVKPKQVTVSGNKVVVEFTPGHPSKRPIAGQEVDFQYFEDRISTADRLRDLAGNPVNAPGNCGSGFRCTASIRLTNLTQ